mgnify:CR=1 FL=1
MPITTTNDDETINAGALLENIDGLGGFDALTLDYSGTLPDGLTVTSIDLRFVGSSGILIATLSDSTVVELQIDNFEQFTITGTDSGDGIEGLAGDDVLYGGLGDDGLYAEAGDDELYGGEGDDYLQGGDGNDTMHGDAGIDYLEGGIGDDIQYGGSGGYNRRGELRGDYLEGGDGNDIQYGGDGGGTDYLDGGDGNDVQYAGNVTASRFGSGNYLDGGGGDDTQYGGEGTGREYLDGGDGNDIQYAGDNVIVDSFGRGNYLDGGAGNDTQFGGASVDYLDGGTGNDIQDGGGGDDTFEGGGGNDVIDGGEGDNDTAIFSGDFAEYDISRSADGRITITHFAGTMEDGSDTLVNVEYARFGSRFAEPFDLALVPEPEVDPFEFNVDTAMQLATAAYKLSDVSPEGPATGDNTLATDQYDALFDGSTNLKIVTDIAGVDSQGFYVRDNAAALVARTDDALIISFRGTNDNTGTIGVVADSLKVSLSNAAANSGPQYTGPLAAIKGLQNAQGKSKSGKPGEVLDDIITGNVVPDEYKSPDVSQWFNLDAHWALFTDLMAAMPEYLTANGIEEVYFTGHSLGGGMVQQAMIENPLTVGAEIEFKAYAFAPPGINYGTDNIDDPRLLNVIFENDPLNIANIFTERTGDTLVIDSDGTGSHEPADYLEATRILLEAGFVTGDRLDDPGSPGTEFGPRMERVALSLEGDGLTILKDSLQDGVFGTSGNDDITVSKDLFRDGGFVVVGLEGNDTIDLSSGEDVFVFREGDGQDTVEDFNLAEDIVVLYGYDTPLDPQLVEVNGDLPFTFDTTVNLGDGDSITFKGLDLDDVEFLLEYKVVPTEAFDPLLIA